jgi:hypothetical protein
MPKQVLNFIFGPHGFELLAFFAAATGLALALSSDKEDVMKAHWFLGAAFLLAFGRIAHMLLTWKAEQGARYLISFILFGAVGMSWALVYDWVNGKVQRMGTQAEVADDNRRSMAQEAQVSKTPSVDATSAQTAPNGPPMGAEVQRRAALLEKLRQEYILSHDNVSAGILAGTEQLPSVWVNERLKDIGEKWTVRSAKKIGESPTRREPEERRLSLEQTNYIVESLTSFEGQPITIRFVTGDTESQVFAQEMAQALSGARWQVRRVTGLPLTFRGIRLAPQDPTDVPVAAEALIHALNDQHIALARDYVQPTSFEYNGNNYVPMLYLFIGRNGEPTPIPAKYAVPLDIPHVPDVPDDLSKTANADLAGRAEQMAAALREYEKKNRRKFEGDWHIHGDAIKEDSYRGGFEKLLRPGAKAMRDEMQRRLGIGPTNTWAIDADALDGPQPLQDAAGYLTELATKLRTSK